MDEHDFSRTLIFEHSSLSGEELEKRDQHFRECSDCQKLKKSMDESLSFLASSPMKAPMPGFTARWSVLKAKREAEALKNENLKLLTIIGVLMGLCTLGCALIFCVPGNLAELVQQGARAFSLTVKVGQELGQVISIFNRPLTILFGVISLSAILYMAAVLIPACIIRRQSKKEGSLLYDENE